MAMLQLPKRSPAPVHALPPKLRRGAWWTAAGAGVSLAWLREVGTWLDRQPVLDAATWGGHHRIVATLLITVLLSFIALAAGTAGFQNADRTTQTLITLTCLVALITMAGILALLLPVVVLGLFTVATRRRK